MDSADLTDDDRKPAAIDPNESVSSANSTGNTGNVKPALKKEVKNRSHSKDRHLKWDEQVIEEHDLLRGSRMKIDEPNTPYTYYDSGAESDDSRRSKSPANQKQLISWDNLQNRLDSVAAVREQFPPSPSSSHAEADQSDAEGFAASSVAMAEPKAEMRKLEFKEHRKRHYNEMELVRQFRQQHPDALEVLDTENEADVEDGNLSD
jgi:protein phosphatase inhibitor 2